ncbi:hypothetical protein HDU80_011450 [Chytriomyces hyalinus]|nr:hypothetical protein HDU80_011450 [Chytriomyces hyalinus]
MLSLTRAATLGHTSRTSFKAFGVRLDGDFGRGVENRPPSAVSLNLARQKSLHPTLSHSRDKTQSSNQNDRVARSTSISSTKPVADLNDSIDQLFSIFSTTFADTESHALSSSVAQADVSFNEQTLIERQENEFKANMERAKDRLKTAAVSIERSIQTIQKANAQLTREKAALEANHAQVVAKLNHQLSGTMQGANEYKSALSKLGNVLLEGCEIGDPDGDEVLVSTLPAYVARLTGRVQELQKLAADDETEEKDSLLKEAESDNRALAENLYLTQQQLETTSTKKTALENELSEKVPVFLENFIFGKCLTNFFFQLKLISNLTTAQTFSTESSQALQLQLGTAVDAFEQTLENLKQIQESLAVPLKIKTQRTNSIPSSPQHSTSRFSLHNWNLGKHARHHASTNANASTTPGPAPRNAPAAASSPRKPRMFSPRSASSDARSPATPTSPPPRVLLFEGFGDDATRTARPARPGDATLPGVAGSSNNNGNNGNNKGLFPALRRRQAEPRLKVLTGDHVSENVSLDGNSRSSMQERARFQIGSVKIMDAAHKAVGYGLIGLTGLLALDFGVKAVRIVSKAKTPAVPAEAETAQSALAETPKL